MTGVFFRAYTTFYMLGLVALALISRLLSANGWQPSVSFWYAKEVTSLSLVITENLRLLAFFFAAVLVTRFIIPQIYRLISSSFDTKYGAAAQPKLRPNLKPEERAIYPLLIEEPQGQLV